MKQWGIKDYKNKVINWGQVPALHIDQYPWYEKGLKQKTQLQIALANQQIYIHVKAQDKYIRCDAKNLNDPVYADSCFEFFVSPWDDKNGSYFNIEISCLGTLYMAYKDGQGGRLLISEGQAEGIAIESSLKESKDIKKELGWELEIRIPLSVLEEMSGKEINQELWYGNFYRCGGAKDDQYAAWNKVKSDKPNFHRPMDFGKLIIQD